MTTVALGHSTPARLGTASTPTAVLVDAAGTLSGDRLAAEVLRVAADLRRAGVRAGDRVLVKGANSASYVVDLLALMHADTSIAIVDHQQTDAETRAAAQWVRAAWVLDGGALTPRPAGAATGGNDGGPARPAVVSLEAWLHRPDAVVLWSSGTTGAAKGVVKPGQAIRDNTVQTLAVMAYRPEDVLAPWLPFSHQYGLSLVLLWWFAQCTLAVVRYERLTTAMEEAVHYRATMVDATPATYYASLRVLDRRPDLRAGLSAVRVWGVGGAPLPTPLATSFREAVGCPLLNGYGMTELGNVALATPDNPIGCGRPLPDVEVRITDQNRTPVPAGELGEIEVRSNGQLSGYLGPDGGLTPVPRGAWYRTNDLGHLDRSGNLHVVGRRSAVHRNGYTLYPESLERKAERCGQPVKVLAAEDERRGATLAFVVADPAGRGVRFWRDRINELLPVYERPNTIHVVAEFPLNANGKVDAAALRRLVAGGNRRSTRPTLGLPAAPARVKRVVDRLPQGE